MKVALKACLPVVCLNVLCWAGNHGNWPVRDQETIQKTLPLTGPPMRLLVDNIEGYIHVTGVPGSDVRITAHKTIRAETDADLQRARSEVSLDITEKPGTVSAYYTAPWRCGGEGSHCHDQERRFYSVTYDIDVEVPSAARLFLSAVNGGDIRVDKTGGDFEVNDINGGIHMDGIAGSGTVNTINGPVAVHFVQNPSQPCSFKSINGALDVWFQPSLSADLLLKVFNGQVYSDFDVSARAFSAAGVSETANGKFIYHSNRVSGARVGSGGPELSFDTLNGSIRLHRQQ